MEKEGFLQNSNVYFYLIQYFIKLPGYIVYLKFHHVPFFMPCHGKGGVSC